MSVSLLLLSFSFFKEPPPVDQAGDEYYKESYDSVTFRKKEFSRDRTWCYYNGVLAIWFDADRRSNGSGQAETGFQNSDIDMFIYGLDAEAALVFFSSCVS